MSYVSVPYSFVLPNYYYCMDVPESVCSLMGDYSFPFKGIMIKDTMNFYVQIFVWTYVFFSLGEMPRREKIGL